MGGVLVQESGVFVLNRYAYTRSRRVLYMVLERFRHFPPSPKKKKCFFRNFYNYEFLDLNI